jgi:hypothetical protein
MATTTHTMVGVMRSDLVGSVVAWWSVSAASGSGCDAPSSVDTTLPAWVVIVLIEQPPS